MSPGPNATPDTPLLSGSVMGRVISPVAVSHRDVLPLASAAARMPPGPEAIARTPLLAGSTRVAVRVPAGGTGTVAGFVLLAVGVAAGSVVFPLAARVTLGVPPCGAAAGCRAP